MSRRKRQVLDDDSSEEKPDIPATAAEIATRLPLSLLDTSDKEEDDDNDSDSDNEFRCNPTTSSRSTRNVPRISLGGSEGRNPRAGSVYDTNHGRKERNHGDTYNDKDRGDDSSSYSSSSVDTAELVRWLPRKRTMTTEFYAKRCPVLQRGDNDDDNFMGASRTLELVENPDENDLVDTTKLARGIQKKDSIRVPFRRSFPPPSAAATRSSRLEPLSPTTAAGAPVHRHHHHLREPSEDDEDSMDTTELARRLRFKPPNSGPATARSETPWIPTEIQTTKLSSRDPSLSYDAVDDLSSSEDEDDKTMSKPDRAALFRNDGAELPYDDDDDDSVDTYELAQRLEANLPRISKEKEPQPPKSRSSATTQWKDFPANSTASNESSLHSGKDEDTFDQQRGESGDDSVDTQELTRRLRAKHTGSSCQRQPPAIFERQPDPVEATTTLHSRGTPKEAVQFRLPSQSDSSDDDDDEDVRDRYENQDPAALEQDGVQRQESKAATHDRRLSPKPPPAERSVHRPSLAARVERNSYWRDDTTDAVGSPISSPQRNGMVVNHSSGPRQRTSSPPQRRLEESHESRRDPESPQQPQLPKRSSQPSIASYPYNKERHSSFHRTSPEELYVAAFVPSDPPGQDNIVPANGRASGHPSTDSTTAELKRPSFRDHQTHTVHAVLNSPELFEAAFGPSVSPSADAAEPGALCRTVGEPRPAGANAAATTARMEASGTNQDGLSSAARTDGDLFDKAFGTTHRGPTTNNNGDDDCVILVDSDSDEGDLLGQQRQRSNANYRPHAPTVHLGLRTGQKSPKFNIVSRAFPKRVVGSSSSTAMPVRDEISNFSDDDSDDGDQTYRPNMSVARRVTEDHSSQLRQPNRSRRTASLGNTMVTAIDVDSDTAVPKSGQMIEKNSAVSGLSRPWRRNRPRLRDSVASNPFNVASVATRRNLQEGQRHLPSASESYGTSSLAQQRQRIQNQRNDILGGSGAGAGGFAFVEHRRVDGDDSKKDGDAVGQYSNEERPKRRGGRKPTAAKHSTATRKRGSSGGGGGATQTSKRNTGGRGRRGGRTGPGRRGAGGQSWNRGGNNTGGVWGDDNERGWQVTETFTREDPAMRHIGGAEISF